MRNLLLGVTLAVMSCQVMAQDRSHKKIESAKIAFITNELELTTEESAAFWPLYNEYEKKKNALNKDHRNNRRDA